MKAESTVPTTRERVRAMVREHPHMNQAEIARALGVSRERVRQIIADEGLAVPKQRRGVDGYMRAPLLTGGAPIRVNTTAGGTVGELLAAADLTARGYTVFFPLTRIGWCDLVTVDRKGDVERIEVRCGRRDGSGAILWNRPDDSKSERRAIILTGEPVVYDPPFPGEEPLRE